MWVYDMEGTCTAKGETEPRAAAAWHLSIRYVGAYNALWMIRSPHVTSEEAHGHIYRAAIYRSTSGVGRAA